MEEVVLVIHLIFALSIIGLVLLQRSEGGGLGIGGSGGMGALATAHTTANVLTRATAICATGFFITSLVLGILTGRQTHSAASLMTTLDAGTAATAPAIAGKPTANAPIGDKPSTDATKAEPTVSGDGVTTTPSPTSSKTGDGVKSTPSPSPSPTAPVSK